MNLKTFSLGTFAATLALLAPGGLAVTGPEKKGPAAQPQVKAGVAAGKARTAEAAPAAPLPSIPDGILPEFKRGVKLPLEERNPYANRVVEKEKPAESGSEAAKILKILEKLQVRGIVRDLDGKVRTVLLGDLALTEGRNVPQLLVSQVDQIFVSKVTNKEIEITWRTDAGKVTTDGRHVVLKLDDRPKVEIVLPGQVDVKDEAKLRAMLVGKVAEKE